MTLEPVSMGAEQLVSATSDACPTLPAEQCWFLAYTKPRQEEQAALHLTVQGFETYLPHYRKFGGAAKATPAPLVAEVGLAHAQKNAPSPAASFATRELGPLFPRYLFFRPGRLALSISAARSTRGVVTVVNFGGRPAEVTPGIVAGIRLFERVSNETNQIWASLFQPGQSVRFRNSALDGLEGLVKGVSSRRVQVLIELLGREKSIAVEPNQLELS